MSTTMLDYRKHKELQPVQGLWQLYAPADAPFAFRATTRGQARAWQRRARRALAAAIGCQAPPDTPLAPRRIEAVDCGGYVREKILLRTSRHTLMPVYLLLPKQARRPLPVVVAFHGHGYGVKDIVGLWENGAERNTPDGYHQDFAVALCKKGFAVAAPEIACFGERLTDFSCVDTQMGQGVPYTCTHAAMLAFHLGLSVVGMRVHDGVRLIDYLQTRKEFDCARIGAMGISGGGMHTFFSACLDERITACVISGYFATFKDSILAMAHCACNFVPGLHRFGEMQDLIGLIAPRPVLVEAGTRDQYFPIAAVKRGVAGARAVYRVFGAADAGVQTDYFEGRHQISGRKAYDFLAEHLRLRA